VSWIGIVLIWLMSESYYLFTILRVISEICSYFIKWDIVARTFGKMHKHECKNALMPKSFFFFLIILIIKIKVVCFITFNLISLCLLNKV